MERARRRLTVLVALDVAGYSTLIRGREVRTLRELDQIYQRIGLRLLARYHGTVIKTMGDGALVEFESVLDAVECTMAFQRAVARRNARARRPIWIRAAIVLADVIVADEDRFGVAIGFATRMQEAAPEGGIAITHSVRWQLIGEAAAQFKAAGLLTLRSVPYPVEAWMWAPPGVSLPPMQPTSQQLLAPDMEVDTKPGDPRPLLVILPFDNLTGDAGLEGVADGAVEEITATLARLRDIRVMARNTAYTYKGKATDVRSLVRQLGVRYVVEGSMRGSRERLRITAQFIDAESGAHLWAGRVDGTFADMLKLQDDVATHIAGALHPIVRGAEIAKAQQRGSSGAHRVRDLTLRALPYFWAHRAEDNAHALVLLDEALQTDARYGLALGLKGWCLAQQVAYMWTENAGRDKALALGYAERAAATTEPDPLVFTTVGATISLLQVDQARPLQFVERALTLDPTFAWAWTRQGYSLGYSGKAREGIRSLEHAIALSPEDPVLFNAYGGLGICHFLMGEYQTACRWAQKALNDRPGMVWANRLLATSAALAGDLEVARSAVQQLLAVHPDLSIRKLVASIHNIDGPQLDRYLHGLRLAGLPDDSRAPAGGEDPMAGCVPGELGTAGRPLAATQAKVAGH